MPITESRRPLVAEGNFDGIQVFALNVLDECHFQHLLVVGLAYVGRNAVQAGQLAGLQAALARNELVRVGAQLAYRHGLDNALNLNAIG
jgi:hypothetical protein